MQSDTIASKHAFWGLSNAYSGMDGGARTVAEHAHGKITDGDSIMFVSTVAGLSYFTGFAGRRDGYTSGIIVNSAGNQWRFTVNPQGVGTVTSLSTTNVTHKQVTVTTDASGRINANDALNVPSSSLIVLGVKNNANWYHIRIYSGAGWNTMLIVTNYANDTVITNTQVTLDIAYMVT